jgi:hypothetical protein
MKCPNCSSQMFVADESITQKSLVTFYRCSLCVNKHVSATPIFNPLNELLRQPAGEFPGQAAASVHYAV